MPAGLSFQAWAALIALGLIALVSAVVAIWLLGGLFQARSLVHRELAAYFTSPIAYVVLVVFLLVTGYRFKLTLDQLTATGPQGAEFPMQYMFSLLPTSAAKLTDAKMLGELLSGLAFWLIYLLIPPLLTMRLFAEERAAGTLELLMTAPVRDWQVVLSKYIACLLFFVFLWVPTLVYLPVLVDMGTPEFAPVWTPFSLTLAGGVAALAIAVLLMLLPEKQAVGIGAIFLLVVLAVATIGWCAWPLLAERTPGVFRIIPLATFAAGVVLWLVLPSGNASRLFTLILFIAGVVAAGVGGWGHIHCDEGARLVNIPVGIDPMPVLTTYLGLLLAGAMFLAIGLLVSSLVRSQLVAALVSLVLGLVFLVAGVWQQFDVSLDGQFGWLLTPLSQGLASLSVPVHLHKDFSRGLIDTRHVTLYLSVAFFSLFLTVRSLESRRWR